MNLTSKRMLKFATVCAGLCALAAVTGVAANPTTWYVEDSFEAGAGTNLLRIGKYKMTVSGNNNELTNVLWVADADDASKLVSDATSGAYGGQRPIMNTTTSLVLQLDTEGKTLTRHVIDGGSTGKTFSAVNNVYVDTLIKFTPSEDTPTIDGAVKVAVYVNVNSNLVVYHGMDNAPVTNSVFSTVSISPTNWYRLTIEMTTLSTVPVFKAYLNGEVLTHPNGITDDHNMFITAAAGNTLSAVAFQGTGFVDELSVANGAYSPTPAVTLLTLSYDDALGTVLTNGAAVIKNGTVESGTLITIDAIDWYNVASVSGVDVTYAGELAKNSATGVVSATAAATANITFAKYSGSFALGGATVDLGKLADWAIANGNKTEADVTANAAGWLDEYLLDIAPDAAVTNTISIASIAVGATDATIKVVASSTAVNFASINGTLKIYTATNLVTGFDPTPVVLEPLAFTPANNTNTVVVPISAGSFIKAKVE